ncbi:MAG: SDR family oxidoreductase [Smithella sp.]|jgi:NAD(P)-dependent dehydrogenase (short-subunit alcohol dehydrogenase family)
MSEINFNGRVAIITGAGAGLGRQYALELGKRGAKVVVNDLGGARDGSGQGTSAADKVVDEIKAQGGQAIANYDNVALVEGGENIVKAAVEKFGKVDILVNNAGIVRDKTFNKMDEPTWDVVMNVHLKGAFCVTRPAFINMRENNYGRIVMTTSSSGMYGNFGQSNYAAAKLGLLGLVNVLKLEGGKYNIKSNLIGPTAATRFTEDVFPPELFAKMKPDFVAPAVLYLCSEDCTDSGMVINAAAGYYSRSAIVTGPGAILSDGVKIPSPEDIKDNWGKITSLDNPEYYYQSADMFKAFAELLK